jgi:hypothetical protein
MAMKGREGFGERMHTNFPFSSFWAFEAAVLLENCTNPYPCNKNPVNPYGRNQWKKKKGATKSAPQKKVLM